MSEDYQAPSGAEHPITPPPELVQQWVQEVYGLEGVPGSAPGKLPLHIATQAARWGADQELEACCEWLCAVERWKTVADRLRSNRRSTPPSLKEQALEAWDRLRNEAWCEEIDYDLDFVRRALEALDD